MKTREELEKLSLPELLTYIEELEKKVEAGAILADYLRNGLLPEDDQMALAAYDNATMDVYNKAIKE